MPLGQTCLTVTYCLGRSTSHSTVIWSAERCSALKHLFSGNLDINLAISKIEVLAKLAAKGILGNEQICLWASGS